MLILLTESNANNNNQSTATNNVGPITVSTPINIYITCPCCGKTHHCQTDHCETHFCNRGGVINSTPDIEVTTIEECEDENIED